MSFGLFLGAAAASGGAAAAPSVNASDFDGTNDWMVRSSDLTGNANSKQGIFSGWVRLDGGDLTGLIIYDFDTGGGATQYVQRNASNKFEIVLRDSGNANALILRSALSYSISPAWVHILASWDLATATSHMYINGVSDKNEVVNNDATIVYSQATHIIGAGPDGGGGFNRKFNGCMSEIYFAPGQYLDFSNATNRAIFINANGGPVVLGTTGSIPTGTAPIIYLKNVASSFNTNSGTGGNFVTTGTLDVASTYPADIPAFTANAVSYNGSTNYLNGLGISGASNSSKGIFFACIKTNRTAGNNDDFILVSDTTDRYRFNFASDNFFMSLVNDAATSLLQVRSTATIRNTNGWVTILASYDTNFGAGAKLSNIYINDVLSKSVDADVGAAFSISYSTNTALHVGSNAAAGAKLNADVACMYFAPGEYFDFSVTANRRLFVTAANKPRDLLYVPGVPQPRLYLQNPAATVGKNSGTGSNLTVNGTFVDAATSPTTASANASDFDGTNDYLNRGAGLTGATDGSQGVFSCWVRFDAGNGATMRFLSPNNNSISIDRTSTGRIQATISTSAGGSFIFRTTSTSFVASDTWYHILMSWDTNFSSGAKLSHLYINDVSDMAVTTDDLGAGTVDYTSTNWFVCADNSASLKVNGCIAEYYLCTTAYLDFSDSANRRKFITAGIKPVADITTSGAPSGIIYLKDPASSFGTNSGTGGNLTIVGSLDIASSSPST